MNIATIETNAEPVRGLSPDDIEQWIANGFLPNPESHYYNSHPFSVSELADFARENGLAMYRNGVQIDTIAPYLTRPAEDELGMDESPDDEWSFSLYIEERKPDGTPVRLFDEGEDGQRVLAINMNSPWGDVSPLFDAEYWLARHVWKFEDTGDPNKHTLRYGDTRMTHTAQVHENWHPPYPSTRCTYIVRESYTDFDGRAHVNSCDEIPEYQTEVEAQKRAKGICEADFVDYLNTEDWSPSHYHQYRQNL